MELDIGLNYKESVELLRDKITELVVLHKFLDKHPDYGKTGESIEYYFFDKFDIEFFYRRKNSESVLYKVKKTIYDDDNIVELFTESFSEALSYIESIKDLI